MSMYQEALMEHYKFPFNRKTIVPYDFSADGDNPSCGDEVAFTGCVDAAGTITDLGFTGKGCVISQAAASMLTEEALGKTCDEVYAFDRAFMEELVGISLGPVRLKCALLALEVLHKALANRK